MKLLFQDEKNNRVYIPDGEKEAPTGDYKFLFKSGNSTITIGSNVKFLACNFVLNESCEISIGDNCLIRGKLFADHTNSKIIIGHTTKFNAPCRIHAAEGKTISIGNQCLFSNVRFRTSDSHSIISLETNTRINHAKDIIIEDKVWIAEDVNIYKGVTIGSGSIVGARATVTKNLPGNALCVGSPAVAVKHQVAWNEKLVK
ncbi:TPA: hypothetical protein HLU19_23675 [Escherichia coli]|uniref:acyltransferase n=1 Tax=Enterobacter roggenkampii TaxID=1812935 RepID=UPI00176D8E8F|nr:acyltransferase [Enterobacter roggenkampii]HAJ4037557.1 hypothetical protein [Escherichia coli]HEO9916942.1 acyltransferase [Enterobacter asburiae]UQQ50482.1 acyltransferase [Enterobacter roggenkampii]HAJ4047711.1 hypothetical protein [Escherichia coli]HAJ4131861.1 hypothetical protein [Escherichia coli]